MNGRPSAFGTSRLLSVMPQLRTVWERRYLSIGIGFAILWAATARASAQETVPGLESLRQFAYSPWVETLSVIAIIWLLWQMSLIPQEARWNHRYELPASAYGRRKGTASFFVALALIVLFVWIDIWVVPVALHEIAALIQKRGLLAFIFSPGFAAALTGLMSEVYLGFAFIVSFIIIAQAAPVVPKWAETVAYIIALLVIILGEIVTLATLPVPVLWWIPLLALLVSLLAILATSWALWISNPNNPLRWWFCTYIAANHFTPFSFLWSSVWGCLKWGWKLWWDIEVKVFEFFWMIVEFIWDLVTTVVKTVFTYTRRVIKWVETWVTSPTWMPNFIKKGVQFLTKIVLVAVEVVEVITEVVTHIVIIPVLVAIMLVWLVVAIIILIVLVLLKLVCLAWGLIVLIASWLLLFFWLVPVLWLRILFLN